jgi:hypothetical protein
MNNPPTKRPYTRRQQTLDVNADTPDDEPTVIIRDPEPDASGILRRWCTWAERGGLTSSAADVLAETRVYLNKMGR